MGLPLYDPTLYKRSAAYYLRGRPPYPLALRETAIAEYGLDGTGRLLDVECGPGVLTVELAPLFEEAVGLDPDVDMLAEAARHAEQAKVANVGWVQAQAEQIPDLDLGTFRLVTFGQSFQSTTCLNRAGALFSWPTRSTTERSSWGPTTPRSPTRYPIAHRPVSGSSTALRARFRRTPASRPMGRCPGPYTVRAFRRVVAPGRPDIVQDADGVVANYLSMSFAAPHLFGDRLDLFESEVRQALAERSPAGVFWDWPGDTEIVIASKPR